ncbi:MarR family winged helix-turn-helix transcriptional regulator [Phaeacidiphilus oryzae]|uniref:MarR family winged helix-turn-helix transcriptional regulator n=1 Tax=Phaeacidiphilus oryzae TaxID=348818 RepID=UPI00068C75A1|nr:MarR family transcriptional regulator [Phaeacidiphilus oryzae]
MDGRGDEAAELADAVQRASRRIRRETFHRLAPHGMTPSQGRALDVLARGRREGNGAEAVDEGTADAGTADAGGREMRLNELAERLRIAPRSATTVVDALEAAGLVERAPDPADRRATLLRLTAAGRESVQRLVAVRREVAEEYFAPLDPADRATALRALRAADAAAGPLRSGGARRVH